MKSHSSVIARHHFAMKFFVPALATILLFASLGILDQAKMCAYAGEASSIASHDVTYALNQTNANTSETAGNLGDHSTTQAKKKDKADNSKAEKKKNSQTSVILMRAVIAIGVSVLVFVIIAIVSRRIKSRSGGSGKELPELSKPKRIAIMVVTAIITYGILSFVVKAHAVETPVNTSANKNYVATLEGDISVGKDGTVKTTVMKLKNSPQTKLAVRAFDVLGNAAGIAGDQIKSGDLLLPSVDAKKYYKPISPQLINNLLKKRS